MTKQEKCINAITRRIESLFNELNMPELYAEADDYFHYDIEQDDTTCIYYSIIQDEEIVDQCYKDFIRKYSKFHTVPISMFTFSLLHEIGHHLTINDFSEADFMQYEIETTTLAMKIKDLGEKIIQNAYMLLPIEYEANIKAIEIMDNNLCLLYNFEDDIKILFEKLNLMLDN